MSRRDDVLNVIPGAMLGIPVMPSRYLPDGKIVVVGAAFPWVIIGTGPLGRWTRIRRWWVRLRHGPGSYATGQEILDRLREEARSG